MLKVSRFRALAFLALVGVFVLNFPFPISRSREELYMTTETYYDEAPIIVNETINVPYSIDEAVSFPYQIVKYMQWEITWYTLTINREWAAPIGTVTWSPTFSCWWGTGDLYGGYNEGIGFQATANFYLERDGIYTFTLGSDDGSKLSIDGNTVIDLWYDGNHADKTKLLWLSAGWHEASLLYYDWTGNAWIHLDVDKGDLLQWEETQYQTVLIPRIYYNTIQIPRIQVQQVPKQRTTVASRTVTETVYLSILEYLMKGGKV
jgi:hypothetical protein